MSVAAILQLVAFIITEAPAVLSLIQRIIGDFAKVGAVPTPPSVTTTPLARLSVDLAHGIQNFRDMLTLAQSALDGARDAGFKAHDGKTLDDLVWDEARTTLLTAASVIKRPLTTDQAETVLQLVWHEERS